MEGYPFEILEHARTAPNSYSADLNGWLRARPFLFRKVSRLKEAEDYVPSDALLSSMNVAIATGHPLLLTGEPGTGKTMAAFYIAGQLDLGEPVQFQVRSDSRAKELLYEVDAIGRYHAQGEVRVKSGEGPDREYSFLKPGALWRAFRGGERGPVVLLIDEIDKAPRDFPNDLLRELEEYRFDIEEALESERTITCPGERIPIIVITSNSERRLPEPFLRRCVYHNIEMDNRLIESIVKDRARSLETTELRGDLLSAALRIIVYIRDGIGLDKRPTVDEFWQWLELLDGPNKTDERTRVSAVASQLTGENPPLRDLPYIGCLVKTRDDRQRLRLDEPEETR